MQQYLIYIIPVAIVLIIFIAGYTYSLQKAAKLAADHAADPNAEPQKDKPKNSGVYEKPGVNQQSDHPLGAVQSVIRGRIRFLLFGAVLIGVSIFGLYSLYAMPGKLPEYTSTPLIKLIATALMAGGIIWGLQLISYITYRVKLRRTGFEISSVFGTFSYEYKDVDFHLDWTIEHKYESEGYRPVFMKTGSFNFIWVCQITFRNDSLMIKKRNPIILKSSRYAWLKTKMRDAIDALYGDY